MCFSSLWVAKVGKNMWCWGAFPHKSVGYALLFPHKNVFKVEQVLNLYPIKNSQLDVPIYKNLFSSSTNK